MNTVGKTNMHELESGNTGMSNETGGRRRTLAEAETEIERLQQELDQAREELDSLTEVTSGFVRLMI